jgi:hypothetical protein
VHVPTRKAAHDALAETRARASAGHRDPSRLLGIDRPEATSAARRPSPRKLALMTGAGAYAAITAALATLGPTLASWPLALRTLVLQRADGRRADLADHDGPHAALPRLARLTRVTISSSLDLHQQPELRAEIERLPASQSAAAARVSNAERAREASLRQRNTTLLAENRRLREQIANSRPNSRSPTANGAPRTESGSHRRHRYRRCVTAADETDRGGGAAARPQTEERHGSRSPRPRTTGSRPEQEAGRHRPRCLLFTGRGAPVTSGGQASAAAVLGDQQGGFSGDLVIPRLQNYDRRPWGLVA